ncbi:zinc finger MYM-type protein 1-like [Ixodes scapularis]|uniref:zinc finger MYM-type protein 1-like n=1 Tax=Ixodes scapularis TaxID=6945 RepID=UPI001A9F8BDE|nr:zinc finger MYM-type protein 1-like [Ixodes scapularis]
MTLSYLLGTEQMSVCVRYLLDDKLHEDFLAFVEVTNLSGQGLASTLMRLLRDKGVDATYLCGQGYDGAANMSGRLNGVQAVIQREHPAALYMHCASHSLNLALCCSCSVPEVRNALSVVQEVCVFFRRSARRSAILKEKIRELHPQTTKRRLLALCETRWVERHEAVQTFVELYEAVVLSLEILQDEAGGGEVSAKAHQLLACIVTPTFIVSINIAAKVLSLTLPLSRQLQTTSLDVIGALSHVDDVEAAVQALRQSGFSTVFQAAGNADDAFQLIVFKDCATVDAVIQECRRFEEAKKRRITANFTRLPNTTPTSTCEDPPVVQQFQYLLFKRWFNEKSTGSSLRNNQTADVCLIVLSTTCHPPIL